jgi:hypothetical protein
MTQPPAAIRVNADSDASARPVKTDLATQQARLTSRGGAWGAAPGTPPVRAVAVVPAGAGEGSPAGLGLPATGGVKGALTVLGDPPLYHLLKSMGVAASGLALRGTPRAHQGAEQQRSGQQRITYPAISGRRSDGHS